MPFELSLLTVHFNFRPLLRIIGEPKIDSRREAQEGQNLLLKRRKGRDMPLGKTRSRNNHQGHFAEGLQQTFRRGLSRPPFGIASKEATQFLFLLAQALTHHAFQQGQNTQGESEQTDQSDAVVIALHVQRSQRQRTALETSEVAFDEASTA